MPRKPVEFDPLSADEVEAARRWYARRSPATADRFQDELDRIIDQIGLSPDLWPAYLHGTRVVRVGRFPYLVVYVETDDVVLVVAVAHAHRRAGYWKRRLP
jgi:plasmid stabilization system protein ParE